MKTIKTIQCDACSNYIDAGICPHCSYKNPVQYNEDDLITKSEFLKIIRYDDGTRSKQERHAMINYCAKVLGLNSI